MIAVTVVQSVDAMVAVMVGRWADYWVDQTVAQ
jgi:hypothetical protein